MLQIFCPILKCCSSAQLRSFIWNSLKGWNKTCYGKFNTALQLVKKVTFTFKKYSFPLKLLNKNVKKKHLCTLHTFRFHIKVGKKCWKWKSYSNIYKCINHTCKTFLTCNKKLLDKWEGAIKLHLFGTSAKQGMV